MTDYRKIIVPGFQFIVPTEEEVNRWGSTYAAIGAWCGQTLTVSGLWPESKSVKFYEVRENNHLWPVSYILEMRKKDDAVLLSSFLRIIQENPLSWEVQPLNDYVNLHNQPAQNSALLHNCIAGSTPIMGWVICKDCGKDMRKL